MIDFSLRQRIVRPGSVVATVLSLPVALWRRTIPALFSNPFAGTVTSVALNFAVSNDQNLRDRLLDAGARQLRRFGVDYLSNGRSFGCTCQ